MSLSRITYIARLREGLVGKPTALKQAVEMSITRINNMTEQEWQNWVAKENGQPIPHQSPKKPDRIRLFGR